MKLIEGLRHLPEHEFKEKVASIVLRNLLKDDEKALAQLSEAIRKE